jgi:rubrerythrin
MVTMVGNESDIQALVKNLILLEHDAIAAYESCEERLEDERFRAQISSFKSDHLQHLQVLGRIAAEVGVEAPTEGDMKQYLTTGKIALADMMGDKAILKAMKTNEDDTVTAYERAARHEDALPESKAFFMAACEDERRHRAWMESTVETMG